MIKEIQNINVFIFYLKTTRPNSDFLNMLPQLKKKKKEKPKQTEKQNWQGSLKYRHPYEVQEIQGFHES